MTNNNSDLNSEKIVAKAFLKYSMDIENDKIVKAAHELKGYVNEQMMLAIKKVAKDVRDADIAQLQYLRSIDEELMAKASSIDAKTFYQNRINTLDAAIIKIEEIR